MTIGGDRVGEGKGGEGKGEEGRGGPNVFRFFNRCIRV